MQREGRKHATNAAKKGNPSVYLLTLSSAPCLTSDLDLNKKCLQNKGKQKRRTVCEEKSTGQTDWCFGKTGGIKKLRYLFDFAYRNVFCKGANVGLGHWEGEPVRWRPPR